MPRGYRSAILAAVGWLALTGASPPNQSDHQGQAAPKSASAPSAEPSNYYAPHAPYDAESCYQSQSYNNADLCAQWRAAVAAEKATQLARWSNWISGIGALLSFMGLVLIVHTLRLTREANELTSRANARATRQAIAGMKETETALAIASRNADATATLVAVSEKTALMQLRAYLAVQKIEPIDAPNKGFFAVKVHVSNDGQTPAKITAIHKAFYIGQFPQLDPRQHGPAQTRYIHFPPILNPRCSDIILTAGLADADYETFRKSGDDGALYIYGRVDYEDSFHRTHWLEYCYRLCWSTRNLPEGCCVCMAGNGTD